MDGNAAMDELKANGKLTFMVGDVSVELTEDDLLITMSQKEGYVSQEDNGMTVVLDANLTQELIEEGFANELISKIQNMRKDSDFEVMDRIKLSILGNKVLADVAEKNRESICGKVLATELSYEKTFAISKEWDVNGEKVTISMEKA